jgi:hypothetical protein
VLGLIETGRAGEARDQLHRLLKPLPPTERDGFAVAAFHELRKGRPHLAARHLRAVLERRL